jgi:hypothetical protein
LNDPSGSLYLKHEPDTFVSDSRSQKLDGFQQATHLQRHLVFKNPMMRQGLDDLRRIEPTNQKVLFADVAQHMGTDIGRKSSA